jgi:putative PIN family toxin of toxin-antitoxin system
MNGSAKPSAVVDTNLSVSGLLLKRGVPYALVEALRAGRFTPIYSDPIFDEYREVLARPHFAERYGLTPADVAAFLAAVLQQGRKVRPRRRLPVAVRDTKDEKFLATALGGRDEYLVSGDGDLLALAGDPKLGRLRIVTARVLLEQLDAWDEGRRPRGSA